MHRKKLTKQDVHLQTLRISMYLERLTGAAALYKSVCTAHAEGLNESPLHKLLQRKIIALDAIKTALLDISMEDYASSSDRSSCSDAASALAAFHFPLGILLNKCEQNLRAAFVAEPSLFKEMNDMFTNLFYNLKIVIEESNRDPKIFLPKISDLLKPYIKAPPKFMIDTLKHQP